MKRYTQKEIAGFLIKFLFLAQFVFTTSCSLDGLNQISVKTIKNNITGEIEEYRLIKI